MIVDILFNLCPECRHSRACEGPIGLKIQSSAKGGVTCIEYSPKPNPKARVSDEHILALPDREPCSDCACRKGSTPNGTHHSMADFELCVRERQPFLCHADGRGRICAGWLRAVKARAEIEDAEVIP